MSSASQSRGAVRAPIRAGVLSSASQSRGAVRAPIRAGVMSSASQSRGVDIVLGLPGTQRGGTLKGLCLLAQSVAVAVDAGRANWAEGNHVGKSNGWSSQPDQARAKSLKDGLAQEAGTDHHEMSGGHQMAITKKLEHYECQRAGEVSE